MSTSFIAFGIAASLVCALVIGLGVLSLTIGGVEKYFGKAKLNILKPSGNQENFSFSLDWNSSKEPARIDTLKMRLFNPFGKPSQIDISRSFDQEKSSFARELNLGDEFLKLLNADGMDRGRIQVELCSSKDGVFFLFDYPATKFKKLLGDAKKSISDISKPKITSGPKIITPVKSFIADTVPGKGIQLAIKTNPAFEAYFSNMGAGGAAAEANSVRENFSVAKVWIEEGCLPCSACEDIYPEVFDVTDETCVIKKDAPLHDGLRIEEAAEACPVEVIKFTLG